MADASRNPRIQIAMRAKRFAVWREMQDVRGRTIVQMAAEVGITPNTFRSYLVALGLRMPPRERHLDERDENEVPVDEMIGAEPERPTYLQERNREAARTRGSVINQMHLGLALR